MVTSILVAVLAAIAAALAFALTGLLQHRATGRAPLRPALHPRLLYDLSRQPVWLLSILAGVSGFALQAAALRAGPLALVQPILAMQVVAAPLLMAVADHCRLNRELLVGAGLCLLGLSAFLVAGSPAGSGATRPDASGSAFLPLALLAVVLVAVAGGRLGFARGARSRAISLALASGVLYGVTAGLLKVTVEHADQGWAAPLSSWTLYALLIAGPAGFLLNQNAFQTGSFVAPIAVITVTDPLVAIGIGLVWLNERLNVNLWALVVELLGLGVMAAGIVVVAMRVGRDRAAERAARAPCRA